MNDPTVSIIVPVYNTQEYLPSCLDSLLSQSLKEIEIIVVDDGSSDDSSAILTAYAQQDSRIIHLQHSHNQGASAARNTGLSKARGVYLGFLDSDDRVHEDAFASMAARAKEYDQNGYKVDIVVAGFYVESSRSTKLVYSLGEEELVSDQSQKFHYYYERANGHGWHRLTSSIWNKLYRRSLFIDNKLAYIDCVGEDMALMPQLLTHSTDILLLPQNFFFYHTRGNSLSNTLSLRHVRDRFTVFDNIYQFYLSMDLLSEYQGQFLQDFIDRLASTITTIGQQNVATHEEYLSELKMLFEKHHCRQLILSANTLASVDLLDSFKPSAPSKLLIKEVDRYLFRRRFTEAGLLGKTKQLASAVLKKVGLFNQVKQWLR